MQIIIHRINTIEQLKVIPQKYGVEIDVRGDINTGRLYLNHGPLTGGDYLDEYLQHYRHAFVIFNIKEAGIEGNVIKLAKQHGITDYFLLDVEFPYLYRAAKEGIRQVAVRYSEKEPIESAELFKGEVDWVWIDTNTRLPLNKRVIKQLQGYKTALVCPERWGRPEDIPAYRRRMESLSFQPNAVMTAFSCVPEWEKEV